MDEKVFESHKRDLNEKILFLKEKLALYKKREEKTIVELFEDEVDCTIIKAKPCLQDYDKIHRMQQHFTRVKMNRYAACLTECELEKPKKWIWLEIEDMPLRSAEEQQQFLECYKCWKKCTVSISRLAQMQTNDLLQEKEHIEANYLQGRTDTFRITQRY